MVRSRSTGRRHDSRRVGSATATFLALFLTGPAWAQDVTDRLNPRWHERIEGAPLSVAVVLTEGDTPTGSGTVTSLDTPFTDSGGRVGFTGGLSSNERFVWYDGGVIFLDSSVTGSTLTGGESTMGISDTGGFVYSPSVDGDDSVWSHNGLVQRENVQAPGFPAGTNNTFNSRPTMRPDGAAYWISGFDDTGGTSTLGRVLYTSPSATAGDVSVVLRSDDIVDGLAIDRPSGIGFDYQISDDGQHHIHHLLMDTGSTTNDDAIYVDGSLVARQGDADGSGTDWDAFDVVSINDSGHYLFSGDTTGAAGSDEFLAHDAVIAVREGDTLDGITLSSPAAVRAASLNNPGWAVHIWSRTGIPEEVLLVTCDASDLASSLVVAATGDMVDVDNDGLADATLTDFAASTVVGPGLWLAEDSRVYAKVDLDFGAGDLEAVVGFELPCVIAEIFADGFESGDASGWSSTVP